MLDINTVQADIEHWIQNFVEVPHSALGGWAPCPYARKARIDRDFEVQLGHDLGADLAALAASGINKSVLILVYPEAQYTVKQFNQVIDDVNQQFLSKHNLIVLADHPADEEIVNGVKMNQGTYALALVQGLDDLDQKAQLIARKGFYDTWPEDYLQVLFQNRNDPRS
jgi:hypothetical protein